MGVFGSKPVNNKPVKSAGGASKKGVKPSKTLRVKMSGAEKGEYVTGLFADSKQPDKGARFSGKDKEGNRYTVYINEDGNGNLFYQEPGQEKPQKLTGLFLSDGDYGPYHSGKTQDGHRFYVADYKPREA